MGSKTPPAVIYSYAPGRGGKHVETLLEGFSGILQVDGYDGYNIPCPSRSPRRAGDARLTLGSPAQTILRDRRKWSRAHCPERLGAHSETVQDRRGDPRAAPEERYAVRQARSRPEIEDLKSWFEDCLKHVSKSSPVRDAIQYGLNQWDGLIRFLDDGCIEINSNSVERSMRPIALNRKNSLFAGHDQGAKNWACLASLIETFKLNNVNPNARLTDVLTKFVNRWPARRIDELMPWAYDATL